MILFTDMDIKFRSLKIHNDFKGIRHIFTKIVTLLPPIKINSLSIYLLYKTSVSAVVPRHPYPSRIMKK
jgi:hypothetical protein